MLNQQKTMIDRNYEQVQVPTYCKNQIFLPKQAVICLLKYISLVPD